MHKFDYFFIKNKIITSEMFSLSNIITDLKSKTNLQKDRNIQLFDSLEVLAIKDSVQASNAIEGIYTTANRINEIVYDRAAPLTHDEEEIFGYHQAILYIKNHYNELNFDEKTIKKLHSLIYSKYSGNKNGGEYKIEDNLIAERNEDGSIKSVIFKPVPAKDVKSAMKDMVLAYQLAKSDYGIPSLLLIPCVILDFLSIHPFKDGNGRVSRLLTLLLLFKEGIDIGKYISFEKMINEYKWNYYESLEQSQKNWHNNKSDYKPFIIYTFQIIYECYKRINERFMLVLNEKTTKKDVIKELIFNSIVPISKSEIHDMFPNISITTIENELSNLIKNGEIIKIGTYKSAKYLRKN